MPNTLPPDVVERIAVLRKHNVFLGLFAECIAVKHDLEARAEMADGCLDMIREKLVWLLGEDGMKGCPAMMYPEAIQEAVLRAARGEFDDRIPAHLRSRADHA